MRRWLHEPKLVLGQLLYVGVLWFRRAVLSLQTRHLRALTQTAGRVCP